MLHEYANLEHFHSTNKKYPKPVVITTYSQIQTKFPKYKPNYKPSIYSLSISTVIQWNKKQLSFTLSNEEPNILKKLQGIEVIISRYFIKFKKNQ